MKILHINSHYDRGGAGKMVAGLHRQLIKEGCPSYVIYGRGPREKEENLHRVASKREVWAAAGKSRILGLDGWGNKAATRRAIGLIRRIQPDVVHLHVLHGYYLNLPMLFEFLNRERIPCVWTLHDCYPFVGSCGYFYECRKWEEGCGSCPHLKTYPKSFALDFTKYMWRKKKELFTRGSRKVIVTPSEWLTGEAWHSFLGKYTCVTVPNGIDTTQVFYPGNREECRRQHKLSPERKLVLGVAAGFDDPRKGVEYILQAAEALPQVDFLLVGWTGRARGRRLRGARLPIKRISGKKNLYVLPPLKDMGALADCYRMADVLALPSLAENYPTVALEAMACGTPVVGFGVGGIPELLKGKRGIVVPVGNGKLFVQGIRRALSPEGGLLTGEALAAEMRRDNSVEKMAREYLKIYRELLESESI